MKKIIRVKQSDNAPFRLTWLINNICTNNCSYCGDDYKTGKNHHYEWENARRFFKILFERYPNIDCSVVGGEPSISPFLPELAQLFQDAGHTIGISSNAAKTVNYWADISKNLNYILFSWHPEFIDAAFEEKVTTAAQNTFVVVKIMMHPGHWDKCIEAYEHYYTLDKIFVEAVRVMGPVGNYTAEQFQWFDTGAKSPKPNFIFPVDIRSDFYLEDNTIVWQGRANHFISRGLTNFKDYTCEIGIKSLYVNWKGDITKAYCAVDGVLGNINRPEEITWPDKPAICTIPGLCVCGADVYINKWIDNV
jgi:organic radical activating enzyme